MSYTLSVTHPSSLLSCDIFPPILLNKEYKYEVGLLSFTAYNSIPNVDESNNKLHYDNGKILTLPTGNYELKDITEYIKTELNKEDIYFGIFANNNTLKILVKSSVDLDFSKDNSIGSLLGFNKRYLKSKSQHYADNIVDIMRVSSIDIQSNISSGAYVNGSPSHSLHMFAPKVAPGYKIIEIPNDVIYLPVDVSVVENLTLKICDQHGKLINFRGEEITVRLHIRKVV